MSGKKNLTPLERFTKLVDSQKEYKTNELTKFQPGTTTSMKQVGKAASAPAGQFDKVLNEQSESSLQLDKLVVARNAALELKKQKEEFYLNPEKGSLDEVIKLDVKDDKKFLDFKFKEEKLLQLEKEKANLNKNKYASGLISDIVSNITDFVSPVVQNIMGQELTSPQKQIAAIDSQIKDLKEVVNKTQAPSLKRYEEYKAGLVLKSKEEIDALSKEHDSLIGIDASDDLTPSQKFSYDLLESFADLISPKKEKTSLLGNEFTPEQIDQQNKLTQAKEVRYKRDLKRATLTQHNKSLELLEDYNANKRNAWSGLQNDWRNIGTLGVQGMLTDMSLLKVIDKKEQERTPEENDFLRSYAEFNDVVEKTGKRDAFWYKTGEGTGSSLIFIGSTFLTGGAGSLAKTGMQQVTKNVIKKTLKNSLKKRLKIGLIEKVIPGAVGLGTQAAVSPTTYASMLRQQVGDVRLVVDKDGSKKVVTNDAAYTQFMKEYDLKKSNLEYAISKLENKTNLSNQDKTQLEELNNYLSSLEGEKEMLRPKSWEESYLYGYTETVKEFGSEMYVGKLGNRLLNNKTTKGWISKLPFQKTRKFLSEIPKQGQNYVNNLGIGKLSSKALYHTGANKIYDGLPGEFIEELVVQATPTLRFENFTSQYLTQLEELANPDFYADVAGQTLLMSGHTTALGAVGNVANYKKRQEFYEERAAIRDMYKAIDNSMTDEDLAETVLMASGGTIFSQVDYDHKIQALREEGTPESLEAADTIEQKKFFNLAIKAIKTNTLDEFEKTLDKVIENKNTKFSEETALNILLAKGKISDLNKTYKKYGTRSNIDKIVDLAASKLNLGQSLEQLDKEILTQRELANQEYQDYLSTINVEASLMPVVSNPDTLLEIEPVDAEEAEKLEKFKQALDKAELPAVQTYVSLKAARNNIDSARKMTVKAFNEQVSPKYEETLQKIKNVQIQFSDSVRYIQENNLTDAGLEFDSTGEVILNDKFIDQAFVRLDTLGLSAQKVEEIKQKYKKIAKLQAKQKQTGSFDRIALLQETAKKVSEEKVKLINATENAIENENVQEATAEDITKHQTQLETVKQSLLHPIILDNEEIQDEYFDTLEIAAPVLLEEFNANQKVNPETIKELFNIESDITAETLSKFIENSLREDAVEEELPVTMGAISQSINEAQQQIEAVTKPNEVKKEGTPEVTKISAEAVVVSQDDFLDPLSLMPADTGAFNEEQVKIVGAVVKKVYGDMKKVSGQEPTFKDLLNYFIRFTTKEKAEESFDAYVLGWKVAGLAETNFEEIYDEVFEPLKNTVQEAQAHIDAIFKNVATKVSTAEEVVADGNEQLKITEKAQVKTVTFNDENVPVKSLNDRRITSLALRFGFNAIKYEEIEILDAQGKKTGTFVRQPVLTDTLNYEEGAIDYRELLDWDKYLPGSKVNVGMVPEAEWSNIRVYVGRDSENKPITKPYSEIFQEKLNANPDYRNSEDFINSVPVVAYNNEGQPVAYIHETSWYNPWNVADPNRKDNSVNPSSISSSHRQAIEESQNTISSFRKAVINQGVNKVTIKEKNNGAFYTIEKIKDAEGNFIELLSIKEANPQSVIVVQGNQNMLEVGMNKYFEDSTRVVINKEMINAKGARGKVWHLRRIGTDSEGRQTWQAFLTSNYKNIKEIGKTPAQELETVKWAWAAYSMFDTQVDKENKQVIQEIRNKFVVGGDYDVTEAQAKKIIKDIKDITGYNLMRYQDADAFFSLFFHPKTGNSRAEFGRQLYIASEKDFYLNVSRDGLDKNMQVPLIENGTVVNTNKTYQDFLKEKLTTGVRSFNIGTENNPKFVTSIQPTIVFEYTSEVEVVTPITAIAEINDVVKAETEEIKNKNFNVEQLLQEALKIQQELGFKPGVSFSALPATLEDVEALKDLFNLVPGLDISQEAHLIDFIYNYINTAIDLNPETKINKEQLLTSISNSYKDIVEPSKQKVQAILEKFAEIQEASEEVTAQKENLINILRVLTNIENHWNADSIKTVLEASGEAYTGQAGIIEKAMQEVTQTSDIKEKKDNLEEEEEEEDVTMKVKSFEDNASLTESGKNKTSYRLRRFMSGVKKLDLEGNVIKGFLGLPTYVNYNEVYDTLYQLLGSGVYIDSNYEMMKAKILEMKQAQPWVVELMERFDKADAQLRNELVVNYRKHAVNMKFTMYISTPEGSKLQVYDTNANEVSRVIMNSWKNNFKASPLVNVEAGEYLINKEKAEELLREYSSWKDKNFDVTDEAVQAWLENFGITLSKGYWNELKSIGFSYQNTFIPYALSFEGNNTPIGLLAEYLRKVQNQKNLNFEENSKAHPFNDMQTVIKTLAKADSKYSGKILSKNFRVAGKNISGITNPTFVTDRVDDLIKSISSGDRELIKNLKSISISSNSTLLELLENDPNFYKKLEANYLSLEALKEFGKASSNFAGITDLNNLDHDITKLGMFQDTQQGTIAHKVGDFTMRVARMFLPTMSDKSQMLTVATGAFNFMAESAIAFNRQEDGVTFTEDLRELLYQKLILPEMKRIANFHKNVKATDIKDYDNAAQLFNFFPVLNTLVDENGDRVVQHLVTGDIKATEILFKEALIDAVETTMHNLVTEKSEVWEEFKQKDKSGQTIKINVFDSKYLNSGKGNLDEKFEIAVYDYVLNSVLNNADMFTVIAGDPALYSQDKLFKEVDKPYFATNDTFYTTLSEKQGINIGKRLALLIAPGRTLAESANKTYKQIFLKDSVDITENAEYLISLFEGEEALNGTLFENASQTIKEALTEYKTANKTRQTVIRKALKDKFKDIEKLGDYFDIESTDAQEYTTLKEHLYILFHDGKLSESKYKDLTEKAIKGITLTKEELGIVLQPIKPVYTGQLFDKDEQGNIKNDVARTVYIKSSSFPLIPELTAGTKLENLRVSLEALEAKYDTTVRASYQTANKVGAKIDSQTIDPLDVESLKGIETAMLTLNRKDFRIQQDVPFKSDLKKEDKVAMGTQIFKLLFGDGMLNLSGFNYEDKSMTGKELYEKYNEVFTNLVENKKQSLFKELGLNSNGVPVSEKVTMQKLQNLLQKEAINRNYPIQDIKSLGLETQVDKEGNEYFDFKIPLWLTTNSDRFESLLNAIVTNRLMNHKIPGNSFVAGSENGFGFQENLSGVQESRVIYLDNYNGVELQGAGVNTDGSFRKAQVLAPSKFKNKEGKLVDLFAKSEGDFIYIEKRENGTWKLKEGMISPELLNQFSFRTPTSSHVSASSIEIVGILPPEVGDLMIVPKNFTKQKGLDFDVDKENVYQLNHIVDFKTGKIEVLNEKHKQKALARLKKLLEEENNIFKSEFGLASMEDFFTLLGSQLDEDTIKELQDQGSNIEKQIEIVTSKLDQKLLENEFIKIHTAVFNNPSKKVQGKINKVLSMDFARQQADLIQESIGTGKTFKETQMLAQEGESIKETEKALKSIVPTFTILSDEYQKKKMGLGSVGKMAIGIYSNYVTFHALTQQTSAPLRLLKSTEEGPENYSITIGKLSSEGVLGKERTLDGFRSIAEVFAERQNTATDNEKEQILGRVNVNGLTIGVDSLLTLLGFDKTTYTENGTTKNLSVAYALLSQPILKDYVEMMQKGKGLTAKYNPNLEQEVIEALENKYKTDSTQEDLKIDSSILTGDALMEGLTTNGSSPAVQLASLKLFLELNDYSKNLAKVQSVLFTGNLGKSIVESNIVHTSLSQFSENSKVANVSSLIGDFLPINTLSDVTGYVRIGDYYVKPQTPQGQIVVQGVYTSQTLWSDFFPYNDPGLQAVISEILNISEVDATNKFKNIEKTLSIIKEVKKYIYSWKGLGLYTEDTAVERKRLFISSASNTSLAEYLSKNTNEEAIVNNKLLNRFTYEVEVDGVSPSFVKYNNTISDNLEEKYLYNSLAELIIQDKPLPNWNGQPFSTKQLAQELITYAYLEGGVQEAIQFIKYIPVEYLSQVGVKTKDGFVSAATIMQRINVKRNPAIFTQLLGAPGENSVEKSIFIKQYFQHNPQEAKVFPDDVNKNNADTFILNEPESPKFITIRKSSKGKQGKLKQNKYQLYEHIGNNTYQRINVLGVHGMNEYQALVKSAKSIIENAPSKTVENQPAVTGVKTEFDTVFDPKLGTVQNDSSVSDTLKRIANSGKESSKRHKVLAEVLIPFASNTQVKIVDTKSIFGVTTSGAYLEGVIYIDQNTPLDKRERVFMHEVMHALTHRDLLKYYSKDKDGFYSVLSPSAPGHVVALHEVWQDFISKTDASLIEKAKQKTLDLRAKIPTLMTSEELEIGYPAVDILEFVAVAFESESFQKYLSTLKTDSGVNLLDKFVEAIKNTLAQLGIEIKAGTLAETSLNNVLNFIESETEIKKQNDIFATTDVDVSALEQEIADRALIEQEDTENAPSQDYSTDSELTPEVNLLPYSAKIASLNISEEEWNSLTSEEKQKIKECN
jgi:hypothetical protein